MTIVNSGGRKPDHEEPQDEPLGKKNKKIRNFEIKHTPEHKHMHCVSKTPSFPRATEVAALSFSLQAQAFA